MQYILPPQLRWYQKNDHSCKKASSTVPYHLLKHSTVHTLWQWIDRRTRVQHGRQSSATALLPWRLPPSYRHGKNAVADGCRAGGHVDPGSSVAPELFSSTTTTSYSPFSLDNCWHGPLAWGENTHWHLWRFLDKLLPEIYNFNLRFQVWSSITIPAFYSVDSHFLCINYKKIMPFIQR